MKYIGELCRKTVDAGELRLELGLASETYLQLNRFAVGSDGIESRGSIDLKRTVAEQKLSALQKLIQSGKLDR